MLLRPLQSYEGQFSSFRHKFHSSHIIYEVLGGLFGKCIWLAVGKSVVQLLKLYLAFFEYRNIITCLARVSFQNFTCGAMTSPGLFKPYTSSAESFCSQKWSFNVKLSLPHHLPPHITRKEASSGVVPDDLLDCLKHLALQESKSIALDPRGALSPKGIKNSSVGGELETGPGFQTSKLVLACNFVNSYL